MLPLASSSHFQLRASLTLVELLTRCGVGESLISRGYLVCLQVVGTALLLLSVSAISFHKNSKISSSLGPLLVALTVVAIGVCFGHNAG